MVQLLATLVAEDLVLVDRPSAVVAVVNTLVLAWHDVIFVVSFHISFER